MNSVYGKFIENQEKQTNIKYVQTPREALSCLNSPYTIGYTLVNEELLIFEQRKKSIILNRPIHIGVSILEFSKLIMFSYYHTILKKTYGDRVRLLYTDTDSFVLELYTRNLLSDLSLISHTLDTSNFPSSGDHLSPLFSSKNSAELFFFKSEVGSSNIIAFIAIRAKVYSLISESSENGVSCLDILNKLKGVNKSSVEMLGE